MAHIILLLKWALKYPQTCYSAWGPGDCGAPMWYEGDDGSGTIVALVEGFYCVTDKAEGTYDWPNYVTLIANADVLDFINHLSWG